MRRPISMAVAAVLMASAGAAAFAEDAPITREEYNALVNELKSLRQEVKDLKTQRATTTSATPESQSEIAVLRQEVAALKKSQSEMNQDTAESREEMDKLIKDLTRRSHEVEAGTTKLLITGDADVGFDAHHGSTSTFEAGVAPRFLWELNKQILFDAAFDVGIGRDDAGGNSTSFDLTIASVSYIVNDYITVGGGLFVAPFSTYHRNYDPSWINKLPDDPLVFSDGGLAPGSVLGMFVSGGFPIGSTKLNYAVYVSNGPDLNTADGSLTFENFSDLNNNKAVGARVGFLPVPELEFGYSFLCGRASPDGFQTTNAFLQAVDVNYMKEVDWLMGTVTVRGEWVWSHVGAATYEGESGPFTFSNNRNGGYGQVSYRPTLSGNKYVRNLEGVFRYDMLDAPSAAPGGGREQRYAIGLDYWLDPRTVLKFAYECDDKAHEGGARGIMFQLGLGF